MNGGASCRHDEKKNTLRQKKQKTVDGGAAGRERSKAMLSEITKRCMEA